MTTTTTDRYDYRRSMLPLPTLLTLLCDMAQRLMAQGYTKTDAYAAAAFWFPARVRRVVAETFPAA